MKKIVSPDEHIFNGRVQFNNYVKFRRDRLTRELAQPNLQYPSWGEFHGKFVGNIVADTDPANNNDVTVTVTNVPTGTMGIMISARTQSGTVGRVLRIEDADSTTWWRVRTQVVDVRVEGTGLIPLNSSKQFIWSVNNADVDSVIIDQLGYWI